MIQKSTSTTVEFIQIQKVLRLTHLQLAQILRVGKTNSERQAHELRELYSLIQEYVRPGQEAAWLRMKLSGLAARRPLDLLLEGKVRDLTVELRRLQEGQPV